jgi:hypothetical protein
MFRATKPALLLAALVAAISFGGCKCLRGPVNASPGLRWWLFSNFGAQQICPEMLKRGVGLKLQDRGPAVGRFFPSTCEVAVNDAAQTVAVSFSGAGYAYTSFTRRVGFTATGAVEYRADFYLGEEDIYVWGKVNRIINGPNFQIGYVENPIAAGATMTPLGAIANMFGSQIVSGELTRGFTVLQNWDTDTKTFGMGIIQPPNKPHTPYTLDGEEVLTFANESIQVEWQQRDFLGPFEVADNDQQLQLRMFLQGPAVEALVVTRQVGDLWRDDYHRGRVGPPPGPILAGSPLTPNAEVKTAFRLPPGQYYVVIDHTNTAGSVQPPPANLFNPLNPAPAASVSYVAQLREFD